MLSVQAVGDGLGLKKSGREFKGACPLCGGDDRFHIKEGKNQELLVYCRHGCSYSAIMVHLENLGLVEKGAYVAPRYRHQDLDFADSILLVARGNLEKDFKFYAEDIETIKQVMSKVDPGRQQKLGQVMRQLIARI